MKAMHTGAMSVLGRSSRKHERVGLESLEGTMYDCAMPDLGRQ